MKYTKFHLDKTTKQYKIQIINSLKLITMKKFLFFAASAIALFASCQKTEVNYEGNPQEISFFAVNQTATKAPVEGNAFPVDYNMQVAAYLAAGDGVAVGGANYFDGVTFAHGGTYWAGGKYWPVSAATLNFLAVAPQVNSVVTTEFDGTTVVSESTTTVAGNSTAATQYDVMYAVARKEKTAGSAPGAVDAVFKHAYSWLDFKFKVSNTETGAPTIKINSVTVYDVATDGTLTVAVTNATSSTVEMTATPSWSATGVSTGIAVPEKTATGVLTKTDNLTNTLTEYYKGLLLVPEKPMSKFVIDYTTTLGGDVHNFTYTYTPATALTWDAGKKYTYEITMTLSQIEVTPSVTDWDVTTPATPVPLG